MIEDSHLKIKGNKNEKRLDRLTRTSEKKAYNPSYTKFIRSMRIVLPLVAVAIAAIVFTWTTVQEEQLADLQAQIEMPQQIGKNELLDPRFESRDEKNQPYTITAKRAIQGETNENLIILEEPLADMLLSSGNWIAIEARQGAFRRDNLRLLLKGAVRIFHDQGYQLETEQLNIDIKENIAWSETDVYVQGPEGFLEAKGLQAEQNKGNLVFAGPAKLTLTEGIGQIRGN